MVEQDTVKLLRECDAGVKMGISSIDDVLGYVRDDRMKQNLKDCRKQHQELGREIRSALDRFHDDGKEPEAIAKGMSWLKTNVKMAVDYSDSTVADLVYDGCNMGMKSLHRYKNQYVGADDRSKGLCDRVISIEADLTKDMQQFL